MGSVFLKEPNRLKKTNTYLHGKIRVVTCEMQGWRTYMEDAIVFHRISKEVFLFAVFDGHGGVEVSQFCAQKIAAVLEDNSHFKAENYVLALEDTFRILDEMLISEEGEAELKAISKANNAKEFQEGSRYGDSVGCTGNVLLLVKKTVYCANAGDSRAALSRNGKCVELSMDHKPDDPMEKARIVKAGCTIQNGRINNHLNLSRCLGDLHYKKVSQLGYREQAITCHPDVSVTELCKEDDFIIMGCDGVWQRHEKQGQGLVNLIREERLKNVKAEDVMENMLEGFLAVSTKDQLGCDNMSAILIQFNKNAL